MALVSSIGKPPKAQTFGDFADVFAAVVFQTGKPYGRIDVMFDRFRETSIKSAERQRRCKSKKAIRRSVEGRNGPLPSCWSSSMASQENKADLANFLSRELLAEAPPPQLGDCCCRGDSLTSVRYNHRRQPPIFLSSMLHTKKQTHGWSCIAFTIILNLLLFPQGTLMCFCC